MFHRILLAGFVAVALSISRVQAQVTVFSTDFNSGLPSVFSGAGNLEGVQGFAGLGHPGNQFSGNFLHNTSMGNPAAASILTLTSLPTHTSVNLGFLLAAIDTWDGTNVGNSGAGAPDFFNVSVDGKTIFQTTINNVSSGATYGGDDIGGGLHQRGFGSAPDRAFDMNSEAVLQNIPYTASTLTIAWFASGSGWQGGTDESWAIDNARVSLNGTSAVPEPGPIALLVGAGVSGMMLLHRRK